MIQQRQATRHDVLVAFGVGDEPSLTFGLAELILGLFIGVLIKVFELGNLLQCRIDVVGLQKFDEVRIVIVEVVLDLDDLADQFLRLVLAIRLFADDLGQDENGVVVVLGGNEFPGLGHAAFLHPVC